MIKSVPEAMAVIPDPNKVLDPGPVHVNPTLVAPPPIR